MGNRRQLTMAKMARERTVKERRARKLEKRQAAAAARKARASGEVPSGSEGVEVSDPEGEAA